MGFSLDQFIIGFLILSLMIYGGTMMVADVNNNYGNANISMEAWFEQLNASANSTLTKLYDSSGNIRSDVLDANITTDNTEDAMYKGMYKGIRKTDTSFDVSKDIFGTLTSKLGVDNFFILVLMAVFGVLVAFAVIYLIRGFKPT